MPSSRTQEAGRLASGKGSGARWLKIAVVVVVTFFLSFCVASY